MDAAGGPDVDDLLLAGERRVGEAAVGDARLVATTHRLLVVRPAGEPRFRAVDRPNVTGVATGSRGGETGLTLAAQAAVLGVVLLAGSTVVGFDALDVDASAGPDLGLGPILRIVDLLLAGLAVLDEVLLAGGAAALLAGAGAAGLALRRERVVVVSVSGGDPIRLPAADPGRAAERVRALLAREASA